MRILPMWFTQYALRKMNREGLPAIIYMHPWEFDVGQPRLNLGFVQTKRHYYNIDKNFQRLRKLIKSGGWVPFKNILGNTEFLKQLA